MRRLDRIARILSSAIACLVLIGLTGPGARSDQIGPTSPIPEIVQRAATVYDNEVHGVVGMQRHFTIVIRAGAIHHTERSDSGFIMRDGIYNKIKYYEISDDGRAFSRNEIGAREEQTNRDWAAGKIFFKEPYDPRFLGDYKFELAACPECSPGTSIVKFSSDINDSQHGSGTMWIDDVTAHVVKVTVAPYKLPPHAYAGTVTEMSTEVMPGFWYPTSVEAEYKGRILLLTGSATFTATFDHFQRFDKVSVANDALDKGTI